MIHTHSSTHLDVGEAAEAKPIRCDHPGGDISFCVAQGANTVWLSGSPADWLAFADRVAQFADEVVREAVPA